MKLPESEYLILTKLYNQGGKATIDELVKSTGLDQSIISACALKFSKENLIKIVEEETIQVKLTQIGKQLIEEGFPERHALEIINNINGEIKIAKLASLLKQDVRSIIKWLLKRNWCKKLEDKLYITSEGKNFLSKMSEDEKLLQALAKKESYLLQELEAKGINVKSGLDLLKPREAVKIKSKTIKTLVLTETGVEFIKKGIEPLKEVTQLTQDLLINSKWKEVSFKKYDIRIPTKRLFLGKIHPLQRVIQQTRKVFLELGFTEISSPYIESCFWDFDALFQPQDHPAREMQDTFYILFPKFAKLPKDEIVERVKRTHETGADTGSTGWGYKWDRKKAEKTVLRTHTTATTIRYLAKHPNPPQKVFYVGKVFRRENIDFKHLPEFYQVDGIIIDEQANFATLLGILKVFYHKMGFKEIRFRPAFFPYTEPSVEVFVRLEERKDWIELGGAGIFRPEVTLPFNCTAAVLAWGLGLERLAMLKFGLDDIRKLYWCDISWLRDIPLCL
jgi:phenylalanyl-tRNA synthetase alpha chain